MTKDFKFHMQWNWTSLLFGVALVREDDSSYGQGKERDLFISIGILSIGIQWYKSL